MRLHPPFFQALLMVVASLVAGPQLHGQLSAEDLAKTPQLSAYPQISISPDSTSVAYVVERAVRRPASNGTGTGVAGALVFDQTKELWVSDLRTGQSLRICCEDAPQALLPNWSPDGKYLAFYRSGTWPSNETWPAGPFTEAATVAVWTREQNSLQTIPVAGKLTPACSITPPLWLKDSQRLLVLARKTHDSAAAKRTTLTIGESLHVRSTLGVKKSASSGEDDADQLIKHFKDFTISDLMAVDITTGDSRVVLQDVHPLHITTSPNHRQLVLTNFTGAPKDTYLYSQDVVLLDLDSFGQRLVFQNVTLSGALGAVFTWSPDGTLLTFPDERRAPTVGGRAQKLTDLLLLNLQDNSTHRLPAEFPQDVGSQTAPVWSSNGALISFIRGSRLETWAVSQLSQIAKVYIDNKDLMGIVATESRVVPRATRGEETLVVGVRDPKTKKEGFWRASAGTRRPQQLLEADITLGTSAYALLPELTPDGSQIIFRSESVDRPPELYQANRDLGDVKQITQFSTSLDLQIMGHSKLVSWNDEDGGQLTGSVLLPPHYQPGHKYPTIVSVYPTDDRARLLNHFGMEQNPQLWNNWQLYASRGYVVFVPDMDLRTSTRTFMSDIAKSVLPGIRKLIELGIVDSKRVACVGVSGGGYATLALLVQSSAFRAGVVVDGPSDLVDLYSYGEGRRIVRVLLGPDISLWKDRGLMIENSPYFFLDRINAPVLILQGTEDPVVPAHQSDKLFSALADLGKDGVYIEYDGEGHGFHVIEHQLDAFKRTLQWFDQHLSDLEETQQSSKLSSKTQERSTQASREIVPVVKHRE